MDAKQFDWLARFSAAGVDRRAVARALAAGFVAEVGFVGFAERIDARQTDPGVLFFESLAARMKGAKGDCDAVAKVAADFQREHRALLRKIRRREQKWDAKTRRRVAEKYQERITRATATLHVLMASCRFRGGPEAPICAVPGGEPGDSITLPGEAQCEGCDCNCLCPISAGECTWSFFSCLGGSHAACCWFGACAGHQCLEQCPNCCNCGVDCCGC